MAYASVKYDWHQVERMTLDPDELSMIEIGQRDFDSAVLQSSQPVIVVFWAPWSRPCRVLEPVLREVAAECGGRLKLAKVNADDHPDLSMWYEIESVPTLLFFSEGHLRARIIGTASKEAIRGKWQAMLPGGGSVLLSPDAGEGNPSKAP